MRHALPGKALGFTMLEALIAVLILAVGVLSVANLLIKSYRFTQQGAYDTLALQLASNMADRMRANSSTLGTASSPYFIDTRNASGTVATNFYAQNCTTGATNCGCTSGSAVCAAAAAQFDVNEWASAVQGALPGGRAVVCRDTVAYSTTSGFSGWSCDQAASSPVVIKMGWVSRFINKDLSASAAAANAADAASSTAPTPQIIVVVDTGGQ